MVFRQIGIIDKNIRFSLQLQVIVYQYWNTDEVVTEIEAEHNQINGTPTILTINVYHSKWSFHNGYEPFYSTTINYD